MLPRGSARKVTIYLNQDTRAHVEPLWSTILSFLRNKHVAGATLLRADIGFGSHEQFHDPRCRYIHGKPVMVDAKAAAAEGYTPDPRCMKQVIQ